MSARGISHIYSSAPKNGGKKPVIGRPSDVEKKPGHSSIVDRVCDVHTKNGILRQINVHKGNYGTYVSVQGHEIKVYQVGPGVWFQKGLTIAEAPCQLHPRELADAGLTDKPVKIYSDFTRLAPVKHHQARQRNLKSPAKDLAINPKLESIMPQYRLPLIGLGAGQSQEDKDRLTALAGVTPELEVWLKTVGK